MASPVLHFVIVGRNDHPIFEADLAARPKDPNVKEARPQYLYHFVLHAALDAVEEQEWSTTSMHLGLVDKFNNFQVSAFSTACHVRFMLLHDGRSEEAVRGFFKDVHELYLKVSRVAGRYRCARHWEGHEAPNVMMNPFFTFSDKILSADFQEKLRQQARLYFRHQRLAEVMDEYQAATGLTSRAGSPCGCGCCCSCEPESLSRAVNCARFCCVASCGLVNAASPWALATAEAVTMVLLYALTIPGKQRRAPYSFAQSCEDVLAISLLRSGIAVICHFWGTGSLYQRPYLYCVTFFGCISLPLALFKIAALEQGPIKPAKHPAFLTFFIAHACFALAHLVAARQVSAWARRRYELGLTGLGYPWEEGEQAWLLAGELGGGWREGSTRGEGAAEPLLQLEEATGLLQPSDGLFMTDCLGVTVHYRLVHPPGVPGAAASTAIVLVHGWGGGVFAWRHVMRELAEATGCSENRADPYAQRFQARMGLLLCQRLHIASVVLVGHADGALLCLRMAALAAASEPRAPEDDRSNRGPAGTSPMSHVDWAGSAPESRDLLARLLRGDIEPGSHWGPAAKACRVLGATAREGGAGKGAPAHAPSSDEAAAEKAVAGEKGETERAERAEAPQAVSVSAAPSGRASPFAAPEPGTGPRRRPHQQPAPRGPPRVRGVFLLSPDLRGGPSPLYAHALARSRLGRAVLARQLRAEAGHVANPRAWADPRSHLRRELVELYRAPHRLHGWEGALVAASSVPVDVHTADRVRLCSGAAAQAPVCLATGDADAFATPAALRALARKLFPAARQPQLAAVPACGHLPQEEAPAALVHLLASFVRAALQSAR
ncbi:hypothetical protein QBZ16_004401 [Prototheca wickerhamii]|uniref:Uncharacterized protein n=1 Tax=Prototheca wickerhamii TaxID=3111 RepID=A0AAD9IFP3_PROWI|nr:hypothetical protein QBZ16_004401 [Prototheca wickerhamii]